MATNFHSHTGKRRFAAFSRASNGQPSSLADDFDSTAKRAKPTSMGSSLLAQSRTDGGVTTPQCLVNLTSCVPKNEKAIRALAAKNNKDDLFAPASSSEKVLAIHKGQIVLHRVRAGGSFKTNLASDSGIDCIGSMNGVSMDTELFLVGVAQTESFPGDKESNNQSAVCVHGTQTIINYGSDRWVAGDNLVADPFSQTVPSQNGGPPRPIVYGPRGIPEEQCNIILRPMHAKHLSQFVYVIEDAVRLQFGTKEVREKILSIKTSSALLTLFHSICDGIFASQYMVSPMHPIRGYAVLFAADRFGDMLDVDGGSLLDKNRKPLANAQFGNVLRMAILAKLNACIEVEDKYITTQNGYAASLPHGGDHQDAMSSSERSRSSLHSKYITQVLLNPESVKALPANEQANKRGRNLREAEARIRIHTKEMMAQFVHRIRAYFGALHAGVALSSCEKGGNADVFLGKTA